MVRKCLVGTVAFLLALIAFADPAVKALIIDGQNNHPWQETTPLLKKALEETRIFQVDVVTSPPPEADMRGFKPDFARYKVVVSNYNGDAWSPEVQAAFVDYVRGGGGFVVVHAANNAFPEWREYNEIIGLAGWGWRDERDGPYLRFRDGKIVRDERPGRAGNHGKQHSFQVTTRKRNHPTTAGLPPVWMHARDELYDSLRGPGKNLTLLATAYSDPSTGGSGEHEPILFTVSYGKGRVFHTTLGHSVEAMRCVGFLVTLQRGAEWAATGKVKQRIPADFPSSGQVRLRTP